MNHLLADVESIGFLCYSAHVKCWLGFPVKCTSPRLKNKHGDMPIGKLAEKVLCHRLGIVNDSELITEAAIAKFVAMLNGQLPDIAISALRALFRMDCDFATAVEDAVVSHGGAGAVETQAQVEAEDAA